MKCIVPIALALCCALGLVVDPARGDSVGMDLLGGFRDFEWTPTPDSQGPDYDELAIGWRKETNLPASGANYIYRIETQNGFSGQGNCQYVGVKNTTGNYAGVYLKWSLKRTSFASCPLQDGDVVTIKFDHIRMTGYAGVSCGYRLRLAGVEGSGETNYVEKYLTKSETDSSDEISGTIKSGQTYLVVYLMVHAYDAGANEPGIYLDGAHLTVSRGGSAVMETVPVTRDRRIKTAFYPSFDPNYDDVYEVARQYDTVCSGGYVAEWAQRLRYYNPDIKVYYYRLGGGVEDKRTSETVEGDYKLLGPFSFLDVLNNHSDWLYSYNPGDHSAGTFQALIDAKWGSDPRSPSWRQVPYAFSFSYLQEYYTHVDIEALQTAWADDAITRADNWRYDGVFADCTISLPASVLPPDGREMWEMQSFLHSVTSDVHDTQMPGWRSDRIQLGGNFCARHLDEVDVLGDEGLIYFDPDWEPTQEYDTESGYTANTTTNTPDEFFNEDAFFRYQTAGNVYSSSYWLRCLQDMDTVDSWNETLSAGEKKSMLMCVRGADRQEDPADGVDGWVHFGVCSYLLGQNEWTTLANERFSPLEDFSVTNDFPTPAGGREQYSTYQYVQYRNYYGDDNGGTGGLVVVNGDTYTGGRYYLMPSDYVDEGGLLACAGTYRFLKPNTGRLFRNLTDYKYTSVITSPRESEILSSSSMTITGKVVLNRPSISLPAVAQIKIDDGSWENCNVDAQTGAFSYSWQNITAGKHTIRSRAYVDANDYEPDKPARNCFRDGGSLNWPYMISEVTALPDGEQVYLWSKLVTAMDVPDADSLYIQDDWFDGMMRGIRVIAEDASLYARLGDGVSILGTMDTVDGERCVTDAIVMNEQWTDDAHVFLMGNKTVGGDDWQYDSQTGEGQRGITGAVGWNNIGNLICTWGRVDSIDSTSFSIDDGAGVDVKVVVPSGVTVPDDEDHVSVTGISSCEVSGNDLNRVIRVRIADDIKVHTGATVTVPLYYGYNRISMAGVPLNPDPDVVFDGWSLTSPNLQRWDVATQQYVDYDPSDPGGCGFGNTLVDDGYWYNATGGTTGEYAGDVSYTGLSLEDATDGGYQYFCIPLPGETGESGGYHMFGYPLDHDYMINSGQYLVGDRVLFSDGATLHNWDCAWTNYWVNWGAEAWDPVYGTYCAAYDGYGEDDAFRAGLGYRFGTGEPNLVMLLEVTND